ncbi:seven-hairpin glycosidase [Phellopilus nigrolimitatus]|nr:seven-hairpin glycosidase [Phellopilus nigrolimitatus]
MLPLHRGAAVRRGGWRDAAGDGDLPTRLRLLALLRLKLARTAPRILFLLIGGTCVCLWFVFTQFAPPPFRVPHPPSGMPHGYGFGRPYFGYGGQDDVDAVPPEPADWPARAEKVKEAFLHAYHGYEEHASPADELLPLTNGSVNNFNGWGVTIVDSLDTMYLMGLHDEFDRGVKLIEKISFTANDHTVPFFETVIRYVGGLLSAYALSHDAVLLQRADELGALLLPAFGTPSGLPAYAVNPATGDVSGGWSGPATGWLAEVASCMMEYKYLAKLTGRKEYYDAANTVMRRMYDADTSKYPEGLLPTLWNLTSGDPVNGKFLPQFLFLFVCQEAANLIMRRFTDQVSIGAMADSAFEYFLKQYLLTNQTEPESLALYLRTMRGIIDHNLFLSPVRSLLYVTDISARSGAPSRRFEHLACFLPGLLALGAARLPPADFAPFSDAYGADGADDGGGAAEPSELERHRWAAHGLGVACGALYADMPAGLGADEVVFWSATELERVRVMRERKEEADRVRAAKKNNKKVGARAPPMVAPPGGGGGGRRPKVEPHPTLNQTAEDERLRWGNVLDAWRAGRYDGARNEYIEEDEDEDAEGRPQWTGTARGPVPGVRDPPPAAPEESPMRDYRSRNGGYFLRPETIESFFILWRTTGEEAWRERGWAAFEAIERLLRTPSGYASLRNVFTKDVSLTDSMPSFFLAETLKYLYLLFSDAALLPLDAYVLNTEAHPFPVFEWTAWEREKFGIAA